MGNKQVKLHRVIKQSQSNVSLEGNVRTYLVHVSYMWLLETAGGQDNTEFPSWYGRALWTLGHGTFEQPRLYEFGRSSHDVTTGHSKARMLHLARSARLDLLRRHTSQPSQFPITDHFISAIARTGMRYVMHGHTLFTSTHLCAMRSEGSHRIQSSI